MRFDGVKFGWRGRREFCLKRFDLFRFTYNANDGSIAYHLGQFRHWKCVNLREDHTSLGDCENIRDLACFFMQPELNREIVTFGAVCLQIGERKH